MLRKQFLGAGGMTETRQAVPVHHHKSNRSILACCLVVVPDQMCISSGHIMFKSGVPR
jgi:hypothetical protein